jgi:MoxR-like ATPase
MDQTALAQAVANWDRSKAQGQVAQADAERAETVARFPRDAWPTLPLDRYALGRGSRDTFSYWLEFGTPHTGSIKGGAAKKHLIYRQKDGTYFYDPQFPNVESAWNAVRSGYVMAFNFAERGEYSAIGSLDALSGGPAVVTKALYLYFPDRFLPIFSSDHMRAFLARLDVPLPSVRSGPELNRKLFDAIHSRQEFHGWKPIEVMKFLYFWADPREVVVKIAPGHDAKAWPDCRAGGYICVGWDEVGDLRDYASEDEFRAAFAARGYYDTPQKASEKARELWTLRELEPGDLVVANKGASRVLAIGRVVEPGYEWRPDREEYKHIVRVEWDESKARDIAPINMWKTRTVARVSRGLYQRILSSPPPPGGNGPRPAPAADRHYFILSARAHSEDATWEDKEGRTYRFGENVTSWRALIDAGRGEFVYYRPTKGADDDTAGTFFGSGSVAHVDAEQQPDGKREYVATLEGFALFARPVPRSEAPAGWNPQHSISAIDELEFRELLRRGSRRAGTFGLAEVRAASSERGLLLPDSLLQQIVAALKAGKHVVLTGAPGNGKTELALAVADAAQQSGRCDDYVLTTATADWTTYETIGGLRPQKNQALEFADGHFLRAIRRNHWLIIDELNRSNFDRAFGQLFTVLSGQPVTLPYDDPVEKTPIALVPQGEPAPAGCSVVRVPDDWRIIGTMNVFDKSLLFEMSFALMRRFAFIELPVPSEPEYRQLIEREAGGNVRASAVAASLLPLRDIKQLGPALFMDIARFAAQRVAEDVRDQDVRFESFYSYLLPQFEGIDDEEGKMLYAAVAPLVGPTNVVHLRRVLKDVLGIELAAPRGVGAEAPEDRAPPTEA